MSAEGFATSASSRGALTRSGWAVLPAPSGEPRRPLNQDPPAISATISTAAVSATAAGLSSVESSPPLGATPGSSAVVRANSEVPAGPLGRWDSRSDALLAQSRIRRETRHVAAVADRCERRLVDVLKAEPASYTAGHLTAQRVVRVQG